MNVNVFCWGRMIFVVPVFLLILGGCTVSEHVDINAPVADVWEYVSNSYNTREWSVYIHHISPLPGVEDGGVGSLRRCFRREDETGIWWDEQVLAVKPYKYRKMRTFNIHGSKNPHFNEAEFEVYQYYKEIEPAMTRLTFATSQLKPDDWFSRHRFWSVGRDGKRIFKLNLANIKTAIEQGEQYERVHPYEEHNKSD
ncbi:MAG: SRPBCC family protein [Candidatus Marinimicrobia bacterium]|nr:SRPBCC family protein [Candidatus Neomarinimicrobiota bacterium]